MNNLAYSQQIHLQSDTSQQLNILADRIDRIAINHSILLTIVISIES